METQFVHFVLLIIAAADQARANAATQMIPGAAPADASGTFTAALSPTGSLPATHYWAASAFSAEAFAAVQQVAASFAGATVTEYDPDTDPGFPERKLAELGLQRITRGTV